MADALTALSDAGVSIWLDDLSRERLTSGSLAAMIDQLHVSGVTTNPSIFAKAIGQTTAYHPQIQDLTARGVDAGEALRALTTFDVRSACDVLRPVYDATDGVDGRVSIEVDPRLAHMTPQQRSPRPVRCGGRSIGPTCSSRSQPPARACRRSPHAWRRESVSTSRSSFPAIATSR